MERGPVQWRLLWGETLQNELKGEEWTVVSSDPEDGEVPDCDKFFELLGDDDPPPWIMLCREDGAS